MKNGYFALIDTNENQLVIGIVKEDVLYTNDNFHSRGNNWDAASFDPNTPLGFTYSLDFFDDPIEMYRDCNVYGIRSITKKRYEELNASKKERDALQKEIIKSVDAGKFAEWNVKKIDNTFVFGCGEVTATKDDVKKFISIGEKAINAVKRKDEIDEEIEALEKERDELNDLDSMDNELDDIDSEITQNLRAEDINVNHIKAAKVLLTK